MKIPDLFTETARDPYSYARRLSSETGRRFIATFCSYAPEEIITAAGFVPFRITGSGGAMTLADRHIQSYCCSLVRSGLDDALAGRLDFIEGTVFPHTCDSIQRLSDIWRLNCGFAFHLDVVMPVKLNTASAKSYMTAVLDRFRRDLEQATGSTLTEEKLRESVQLHNRLRDTLKKLYSARVKNPGFMSGSDFQCIMKSCMVMDRGDAVKETGRMLETISTDTGTGSSSTRIFLAGGACTHPDIYSIIENCGGVVVSDELCTGSRYFQGRTDEKKDPVHAMADRFCDRIVCPAKHHSCTARAGDTLLEVKKSGAQGVIFFHLKFCDPHSFDYPYMKEYLYSNGIPSMLIEIDEKLDTGGQAATKIEAFISTLS